MKTSKLFHWLYAILMLLPFAFFVPSILYYAFNDNATMQSVEIPKTETISVDFNQYSQEVNFSNDYTDSVGTFDYVVQVRNNNVYQGSIIYTNVSSNGLRNQRFVSGFNGDHLVQKCNGHLRDIIFNYCAMPVVIGHTYICSNIFESINPSVVNGFRVSNMQIFDLTQMYGLGNEPTTEEFFAQFPNSYYLYTESELKQITYDTGTTEQLIENTSIVNYAWESIWDLPLFSWSKVSFVAVPFTYITGLFGLAPSNSFNYVFTYFASMSIIWLVFDVVLYVPLLVHRWLDKGIVE